MPALLKPPSGPSHGSLNPTLIVLSPAEAAFLRYLTAHGGEADSLAIRRDLAVANISETARSTTRKLALAGDVRRIECLTGSTVDPTTGRRRPVARWRLVVLDSQLA